MIRSHATIFSLPMLVLAWSCLAWPAFTQHEVRSVQQADVLDHSLFNDVLMHYVNEVGEVDYTAIKESDALSGYLDHLSHIDPTSLRGKEAIAFWINAYNAYTIKLIIDNYPVNSIKEITPFRIKGLSVSIPKINSPFKYKIAEIAGKKYSLDYIEHGILRKKFEEPRIHFALVCASYSCPPLRREAFTADNLDEQLNDQAVTFLHNRLKNRIAAGQKQIYLSRIFKWFKSDFTKKENTLQEFLAPFFEGETKMKLQANAFGVKYLKYNWSLNDVGSFNN